jgi:hypothetical protein
MLLCGRGAYCRATLSGAGGTFSGVCDTLPALTAVRCVAALRAAAGPRREPACRAPLRSS